MVSYTFSQLIQKLKNNWLPISVIIIGLLMLLASFIWRQYTIGSWLQFFGFVCILIGALQNMVTSSKKSGR